MKKMSRIFLVLFLISGFSLTKAMFTSLRNFAARYYPRTTRSTLGYSANQTSPLSGSGQQKRLYSFPRVPTPNISQTSSQAPATQGWLSRTASSVRAYFDPEGARIAEEKARKEESQRRLDEEIKNISTTIAHNPSFNYAVKTIIELRTAGKTPEEISRLQPIDWNRVIMTLSYLNPDTVVRDAVKRMLANTISSATCENIEDIQKLYDTYFAYISLVPGLFDLQELNREGISQEVKNVIDAFWSKHVMSISLDNLPTLSSEERLALSDPVHEYFNIPEVNRISFVAQLKKEDRDILMEAKEKGINTDRQFRILVTSAGNKLHDYRKKIENPIKTIKDDFHRRVEEEIFKPRRDAVNAHAESFAARNK